MCLPDAYDVNLLGLVRQPGSKAPQLQTAGGVSISEMLLLLELLSVLPSKLWIFGL
jgi:hypothetical protein